MVLASELATHFARPSLRSPRLERIRERMAKTGERYSAARQQLINGAGSRNRTWVSEPETTDDAVRSATGRGWEEWCDIIDAWPGAKDGHTAVAKHLETHYDTVSAWWAQGVTVGWERITGKRLPGEMPDGTFTANKSRTLNGDAQQLRELLLNDDARRDLFPGQTTELRSRATAKAIRISVGPGVALFGLTDKGDGRVNITIQHAKLPDAADVDEWKFYWTEWLDAVDEG